MTKERIAEEFVRHLQQAINAAQLPNGFYDSFKFTKTGRNLCHPITVSMIGNAVATLQGVAHVGIDVRLNVRGVKFQPDVVGFRQDLSHVVYVDFESPNSSDSRIPTKDVLAYLKWAGGNSAAPYIVVTSLPDRNAPDWQFRYPNWEANAGHKKEDVRRNPLQHWSGVWRARLREEDFRGHDLSPVTFLNIDGKSVRQLDLR